MSVFNKNVLGDDVNEMMLFVEGKRFDNLAEITASCRDEDDEDDDTLN
jgi:hypothetical protein